MNSPEFLKSRIRETAAAIAIEQVMDFAGRGYSPREAIAAVGTDWGGRTPDWDDAVAALTIAWRRKCAGIQQKPDPAAARECRLRGCLVCGATFLSHGAAHLLCDLHRRDDETIAPAKRARIAA